MYIHLSVFIKYRVVPSSQASRMQEIIYFVLVSTTFVISTKQRIAVIPAICSIFWASRAAG